jgi:hypothetical protein
MDQTLATDPKTTVPAAPILGDKYRWDFNGKLRSISVCAHAKLDPVANRHRYTTVMALNRGTAEPPRAVRSAARVLRMPPGAWGCARPACGR